jgi:hypothetical protein
MARRKQKIEPEEVEELIETCNDIDEIETVSETVTEPTEVVNNDVDTPKNNDVMLQMLYIPVVEAIENQLKKDQYLRNLRYYRFSIPTSSVKSPFICCPFTQINEYTSHAHPCIVDTVTNSCVGNHFDLHMISIPILIGAARHRSVGHNSKCRHRATKIRSLLGWCSTLL